MGYCVVQDLESYYLGTQFKCGDYLTNGKADEFIEDDTSLIDTYLKTRYALPITNKTDIMLLKSLNVKMVVGTIDDIFRERTDDGNFARGRSTRKEALDILKQIKEGDLVLNSSGRGSVMKFNRVDSTGENVNKRFKDSNIEPGVEPSDE